MNETKFAEESQAYASLAELMTAATQTKLLFSNAGLDIPAPLARLFGHEQADEAKSRVSNIPRLPDPKRPSEAENDWLWVKKDDMLVGGLVLASLRQDGGNVRPKEMLERIAAIRPDIPSGSIYNIGPRLDKSGVIAREEDGWRLLDPQHAPVLVGDHLWGPREVFTKTELACHRRYVILHILQSFRSGLQIVQIVDQLVDYGDCRSPISKDLVKVDMNILTEAGSVKRSGNTRKYILTDKEAET